MTLRDFVGRTPLIFAFCALAWLSACAQKTPVSPLPKEEAPKAKRKPVEFEARGARTAALLVPLTGPSAGTGKALVEAALMAALDAGGRTLKLAIYDTGDGADTARAAAEKALQDGAAIILGPLYSAQVTAVGEAAREKRVSVLGFTNDAAAAASGAYALGFSPGDEVRRVVLYAKARGLNKIAALYPEGRYGEKVRDATAKAAGELILAVNYAQPVKATIPSIRKLSARGVKFNALMVAEGHPYIRSLAPLLPAYGITPDAVKLIGAGLWDDDALGNEAVLMGAWYAAPPPGPVRDFFARYRAAYGRTAPRIATLAYDSVMLAHALIDRKGPKEPILPTDIETPDGFRGIDGLFRLLPGGYSERALAILELHPRKPAIIDPAAERFTGRPPLDLLPAASSAQ